MRYTQRRKQGVITSFTMKVLAFLGLFLIVLVLFFTLLYYLNQQQTKQSSANPSPFVTRIGNKLYLTGQVFRFAGTTAFDERVYTFDLSQNRSL